MLEFISPGIPSDTDTERYCPECKQMKPYTEFYKDGKSSTGEVRYRRDCKECYKAKRKEAKAARRRAAAAKARAEMEARKKARRRK